MNTPHQDPLIARYHEANAVLGQQPPGQLRAAVMAFAREQAQARAATPAAPASAPMPPREAANEPRWLLRALGSLAMVGVIGWVVTHFDTSNEAKLAEAPAAAEADVAVAATSPAEADVAAASPASRAAKQAQTADEPTVVAAAPAAPETTAARQAQADTAGAKAQSAELPSAQSNPAPVVASASPQRSTPSPARGAPAAGQAGSPAADTPAVVAQADTQADAPHASRGEAASHTARASRSAPRDAEHSPPSPSDRVQVAAAPASAPIDPAQPPAAAPAAAPVVAAAPMAPPATQATHEPVVVASADEHSSRSNAGKSTAVQAQAEAAPDAVAAAEPGEPRARTRLSKTGPAVASAPSVDAAAPSFPAKPAANADSNAQLREAAARGDVAAVQALVRAGAELNTRGNAGQTALMQAAARGDVRMVRALLALGADRQLRDDQGRKAADLAEAQGHSAVQQLLAAP